MPQYPGTIYTLADAAKRRDTSGRAAAIIEILSQTNEIINDATAVECNNGTTHKTTLRDSIPMPGHRMLNQGAKEGKSGVREIVEGTCLSEICAPIDNKLLELCKTPNARREFMLGESKAFLEGMSQAFVKDILYGDQGLEPAGIDGIMKRYGTLTGPISRQIIDMGGTGPDLTSILLVQWGEDATQIIYPQGTASGIEMEVGNTETLLDDAGQPFRGRRLWYSWNYGLAVRDARRIVRICNIDVAGLQDLIDNGVPTSAGFKLRRALEYSLTLLPSTKQGNTFFYMNRFPLAMLDIMGGEKGNVNLTYNNPGGAPQPYSQILGIPIRRVDGLLVGEDQVV